MTTDMDDDPFFELFKSSYPSVFAARIMRQPDGTSKNFAFVRFHDEAEYREALTHEDRISLLLGCHIRICKAHPRPPVPRRWPAAQSRLFAPVPDPGPQLIDPSAAKFHTNPALLSANLEQQRMRQSSPSGQQQPQPPLPHSAQPFLPDQMPAVYYIPVPGYPHYADPAYWANQWHELYPQPDVSHAQLFGHAVGLAEAGDTANMQPCHSFARPAWQMHLPPQQAHFLPDQRFVYNTGEVVDAADVAKHSSSAKSDQYQVSHDTSVPVLTAASPSQNEAN